MTDPRRSCRTGLRLSAVALVLVGVPAFAATPASALDGVLDPLVPGALTSPSPSPSPSPTLPAPLAPLPAPVQSAVNAVVPAAPAPAAPAPAAPAPAAPAPAAPAPAAPAPAGPAPAQRPVTSNGSAPQQVAGPMRTTPAAADAAAALAGGFGSASLSLGAAPAGLAAFTGLAGVPSLGAPMIAEAGAFTLPGLAPLAPQTAPEVQIAEPVAASRPSSGTPAGLPGVVIAVAVAAAGAAAAGQVSEARRRRVKVTND